VIHLAAESHVDRSIEGPMDFVLTNVVGTVNLLEAARATWKGEAGHVFHHVSTDEVYGSLGKEGKFTETTAYAPNSPYSASKAASDMLVRAYDHTFKSLITISNCSNNYGPHQHHEKFIPTIIRKAKANEKIPVYGDGKNIRDWLYVADHCDALLKIASNFVPGERYNIGGQCELSNIVMTRFILDMMGKPHSLIEFVTDRPGHDARYAISYRKLETQLGWKPVTHLEIGLKKTLEWYNA
jgi:dTDP-glucose 4,6-dehydratase